MSIKCYYRICDSAHYADPNGLTGRIQYGHKLINKLQLLSNFLYAMEMSTTLIFDNCRPDQVEYYRHNLGLDEKKIPIYVTSLGNTIGFKYTLGLLDLSNPDDIIYMVEDDYIHRPNWNIAMAEGLNRVDYVSLFDHADKYIVGPNPYVQNAFGETTQIFHTRSTHWKLTNSTCMTFAAKASTFDKDRDEMARLAGNGSWPNDFGMWECLRHQKGRTLATPIPGYATHLCKSGYYSPVIDWSKYIS